jgi:hypothetical protein
MMLRMLQMDATVSYNVMVLMTAYYSLFATKQLSPSFLHI